MMEENLIVIRDPKTFDFDFDWLKDIDENFKNEIEYIIKSSESLAGNKLKNKIEQLLSKYKRGRIFMNRENSKVNGPHKFVLNLS